MIPIIVVQEEVLFREMPKELTSTVGSRFLEPHQDYLILGANSKEKKSLESDHYQLKLFGPFQNSKNGTPNVFQ